MQNETTDKVANSNHLWKAIDEIHPQNEQQQKCFLNVT